MKTKSIKYMFNQSLVPILFIIISLMALPLSGYTTSYVIRELIARISRNVFLVMSLLLPIMSGMGINFSIVMGAMSGQIGLILITDWGVQGIAGIFTAALVATPIAIILGIFGGHVLNRAKGREMITSMMLGLFMAGVYQFFLLYLFGSVIPIRNKSLLLARGYGIKNTIRLDVAKAMDSLLRLRVGTSVIIPVFTFIVIAIGCVFIYWFRKTKLGQDMRATGFDIHVSRSAGINVDKVRLQSVIISTVLACYGQIIFLQNIGNINVYNGADQVHLFATAALLVGGAAITKALISNVLVGTVIFHLMFIVMPAAGNAIMGQAILGEHLRMFISYGVVTIALVIHAWKNKSNTSMD